MSSASVFEGEGWRSGGRLSTLAVEDERLDGALKVDDSEDGRMPSSLVSREIE
jgi:hypothetical protein